MNDYFDDIPDYESDELNEPYEPDELDYSTDEEEQYTDDFTEDSDGVDFTNEVAEDDTDFDEQNTMENFDFHNETSEEVADESESSEEKQALLNEFVGIVSTIASNKDEPDEDGSVDDEITEDELSEDESSEEESAYEDAITYADYSAYEDSASESNRPWENNNSSGDKSIAILLGIIAIIITIIIAFGVHIVKNTKITNIADKTEETVDEAEDIADETEDMLDSIFDDEDKPLFTTSDYSKDFDDDNTVYFNGCKIVLRETTLSELGSELGVDFTEENTDIINEFDDTAESMSYIESDGTEDIYIEGYYDGPATEADLPNFVITEVSFTVDSVESFNFFGVTQDSTPEEIVKAVGDPYLTSESYYGTEYSWVTTYTFLTIDYDENNEIVHIRVFNC